MASRGRALAHAAPELRADFDIAKAAVPFQYERITLSTLFFATDSQNLPSTFSEHVQQIDSDFFKSFERADSVSLHQHCGNLDENICR